jgi:hypothetical protein
VGSCERPMSIPLMQRHEKSAIPSSGVLACGLGAGDGAQTGRLKEVRVSALVKPPLSTANLAQIATLGQIVID